MSGSRVLPRVVVALAVIVIAALVLADRPLTPAPFPSHARPPEDVGEALDRVAALGAAEGPEISPECRTLLLWHGERTPRVVLLLHGLTNCPEQFRLLGERLYARGANVLIPRLPEHGRADRMTTALARIRAGELCAFTDRAVDIARGLGDSVVVVGLSVGGTMAAWAAQERADVRRAVVIAPLIGYAGARGWLTPALTRLGLTMPNTFVWWDSKARENLAGPRHVYPRFASRAAVETLLLGAAVQSRAAEDPPAARSIVMVTVGGDHGADNAATARLVRAWSGHGGDVLTWEFPARLHLNHDIIDPEQVGGNPALVYPVLDRLILP
ncbi:MAG TPA: alpha/beta fold hydrolase [Terriglobales bacterium]|nr:alpha/beta fold hydrolase [Terriglobales bacterium]